MLLWSLSVLPSASDRSSRVDAQSAPGRIVAPVNRQIAWLNLEAPRPRAITQVDQPSYVTDVAASPDGAHVAAAVAEPLQGTGRVGTDLLTIAIASGQASMLVERRDGNESLGAPAWWPDADSILFERQDHSVAGVGYPGTATVLYPTRIEMVQADGSARTVLVDNGRQPAPAPDGHAFAFVRTSETGTSLLVRTFPDPAESVLVLPGLFRTLASPRYSPQGDRLAFMAPGTFVGFDGARSLAGSLFAPSVAWAHGLPWDLWQVNADGSDLRRLAELSADDGSLVWSPDGSQIFVYGGTGSFLVDAHTGEVTSLAYVSGYGSPAWLAD